MPLLLTPLTFFAGCSHVGFHRPVPPKHAAQFKVVAVGAVGKRYVEETYTLSFENKGKTEWTIHTVQSSGTIEAAGLSSSYDSSIPKSSDPWPATIQFALGNAPATIQFDAQFRPSKMTDPDQWKTAAWDNIRSVGLPDSAQTSVEAMLRPEDFVQNLVRDFPGAPDKKGQWAHPLTIAGLTVPVLEECQKERRKGSTRWRCTTEIPEGGTERGRLFDIKTETELEIDRNGLVKHTFSYDAVLVRASSSGQLSHHPVAGKRRVQRLP